MQDLARSLTSTLPGELGLISRLGRDQSHGLRGVCLPLTHLKRKVMIGRQRRRMGRRGERDRVRLATGQVALPSVSI